MKEGKLCRELELVLSLFLYYIQISLLAHFTASKLVCNHIKKVKREQQWNLQLSFSVFNNSAITDERKYVRRY